MELPYLHGSTWWSARHCLRWHWCSPSCQEESVYWGASQTASLKAGLSWKLSILPKWRNKSFKKSSEKMPVVWILQFKWYPAMTSSSVCVQYLNNAKLSKRMGNNGLHLMVRVWKQRANKSWLSVFTADVFWGHWLCSDWNNKLLFLFFFYRM